MTHGKAVKSNHAAFSKDRKGKNLSLVLWFAFSLFAVVIILLWALVQSILVSDQYKERVKSELYEAGNLMKAELDRESEIGLQQAGNSLYELSNRYGLSLYFIYDSGECVFPERNNRKSYPLLAQELSQKLGEDGRVPLVYQPNGDSLAYAASGSAQGKTCYIYLTRSLDSMDLVIGDMRWTMLAMGLFVVVLAFVASGYVSMLITKPVTEVAEKAKELARGNYDVKFDDAEYSFAEMAELSDALGYASSEISKADRMQKELIANVSHDFKTPLTMIKAYAFMIQEISGDDKEKRTKHTQVIIDETDRLAALVSDLLDISKIRADIAELERAVFNLSEEIFRVVGRFGYLSETQGYKFETEIEDDLYVCASRERVEQVLYNLIGNAANYTGEDKRVKVRLLRRGEYARFEVIDTGKGIPESELDGVWERYYRSSETHKRPVRGTGLGLSICKTVLQKHGFPFGIISEVGKGSCFWVNFPVTDSQDGGSKEEVGIRSEKE